MLIIINTRYFRRYFALSQKERYSQLIVAGRRSEVPFRPLPGNGVRHAIISYRGEAIPANPNTTAWHFYFHDSR